MSHIPTVIQFKGKSFKSFTSRDVGSEMQTDVDISRNVLVTQSNFEEQFRLEE